MIRANSTSLSMQMNWPGVFACAFELESHYMKWAGFPTKVVHVSKRKKNEAKHCMMMATQQNRGRKNTVCRTRFAREYLNYCTGLTKNYCWTAYKLKYSRVQCYNNVEQINERHRYKVVRSECKTHFEHTAFFKDPCFRINLWPCEWSWIQWRCFCCYYFHCEGLLGFDIDSLTDFLFELYYYFVWYREFVFIKYIPSVKFVFGSLLFFISTFHLVHSNEFIGIT